MQQKKNNPLPLIKSQQNLIPSLIAFHKQDLKQLLPYIICYIKSLDDINNPKNSDLYQKLETNLLTIKAREDNLFEDLKNLLKDLKNQKTSLEDLKKWLEHNKSLKFLGEFLVRHQEKIVRHQEKIVRDQQETVRTLETIYGIIKGDATINCSKMKKVLSQFIIRDLKRALKQYETYLKDEVSKYKNDCKNKAQERLEIITELINTISSNKDIDEIYSYVSEALEICAAKEPTWLEKPFLEQILDILSLGILPLIRWIQEDKVKHEDKVKSWLTNVEEGNKIYSNLLNP